MHDVWHASVASIGLRGLVFLQQHRKTLLASVATAGTESYVTCYTRYCRCTATWMMYKKRMTILPVTTLNMMHCRVGISSIWAEHGGLW